MLKNRGYAASEASGQRTTILDCQMEEDEAGAVSGLDIWSRLACPSWSLQLVAGRSWLAVLDYYRRLHFAPLHRGLVGVWSPLKDSRSDAVAVSPDGHIVWRLSASTGAASLRKLARGWWG